jgi:hypothetical protein
MGVGVWEDTRDRKREMHEDKEDDESAKRKKGQKRKNQQKEKKKGAKQRCKKLCSCTSQQSAPPICSPNFSFMGGVAEK